MNNTKYSNGFTLLELLITIAITAIVVALAAPSFTDVLDDNILLTQTNQFATAINVARSESVKRNSRVVICKRAGTQCSTNTTTNWEDGWIIFADADDDDTVDSGEEISMLDPLRTGYTLRANNANTNWLAFSANGQASSNTDSTFAGIDFNLCSPDQDTSTARLISMNAVGRTQISKGVAACP